jgi:sarcosine/dimethylglycine N-methyltransferase
LDVASGRGGPAIILAETFGCHITCVEKAEEFDAAARRRVGEAGLDSLIEFVHADAQAVREKGFGADLVIPEPVV